MREEKVKLGEGDKYQKAINHRNNTLENYSEENASHKVSLPE